MDSVAKSFCIIEGPPLGIVSEEQRLRLAPAEWNLSKTQERRALVQVFFADYLHHYVSPILLKEVL